MTSYAQTPLGYLMDMLYIQGTKLANAIYVDRTVISRWKNGHIKLNAKSPYFPNVVNAILDFNEQQGLRTLERFFESVNSMKIKERDELQSFVVSWLLSEDFIEHKYEEKKTDKSLYSATYKVYKGPLGKRDAIIDLLNILMKLPGGETVRGYDTDSPCLHSFTNDITILQKKFIEAEKNGHQLIMMFYMNRPADQIHNMFQYWLPMFLHTNSHAYYTNDANIPFYDYIYSIKGKLVLAGCNFDDNPANMYTAMYDDPMTVHQFDMFLEGHMDKFSELMRHLESRDMTADFRAGDMGAYMTNDMNQYVIAESTPFITFSHETEDDVLMSLDISSSEVKKIQQFYRKCKTSTKKFLSGNNMTRVLFSADYIKCLCEKTLLNSPVFSCLLGRPVKIPSEFLLREIAYFMRMVKDDPTVEVGLRPMGSEPFIKNLNIWVKENTISYFHPSNDVSLRMLTDEFSYVNAFYSMIDHYWAQLPYECKRQEWVYDHVGRLMQK